MAYANLLSRVLPVLVSAMLVAAIAAPAAVDGIFSDSFDGLYTLSVNRADSGSGAVSSSPVGISCGTQCSAAFTPSTVVVLAATASTGSTFSGWSGACASPSGSCNVTMTTFRAVAANFLFTGSDPFNCGAPGLVCRSDQICSASSCTCRPGLTQDGLGACVDLRSDPINCGGFGNVCGGAANRCLNGACQTSCGSALACGSPALRVACVAPLSDPLNCGGCGLRCGTGEVCIAGNCDPYTF